MRTQAELARYNAKSHLEDANRAVEFAGDVQRSGEEAGVNRYLQLQQDIGRIYAGAAGGNIDVSSATVRHVDASARSMAQRDVSAINRSAQQSANQYVDQARDARLAYISDMTAAKMQDIQASYNNKIARSNARLGTWSAVGSYISSIGGML